MPRKALTATTTPVPTLRLEFLCAQKDAENAHLRLQLAEAHGQHIITHLRQALQASPDATFDPTTMTFTEVV